MKKIAALTLLVTVFVVASGQTKEDVIRATGVASGYRAAVNEALVSALEQHDGITVNSSEIQNMTHADSSVSSRDNGGSDEKSKLEMNNSIEKSMRKWAKGKITGYTVVSETIDASGKNHVVLDVRFPGKYVVGRDPDNLRRMAVAVFRARRPDFRWYGQTIDSLGWSDALANQLNVVLTQTRKFTMLDRSFDAEVNAELSRLGAKNAAPADVVRLNQKLGTDYLVVGEVSFNDVVAPGVNPITGQALPMASSLFAEVNYRVLLAPTGQLKWADTVRIDASAFAASDPGTFISMTAEAAAGAIGSGLMDNILPFEVAAVKSGMLVIGEGGKRLLAGDRFTVCALGDEITDTRTGEVIDVMEIPVATAEIVSVQPKLSYARIIDGDAAKVKAGARLRRIPAPQSAPAEVPVTTTIRANGSGGVVTPF